MKNPTSPLKKPILFLLTLLCAAVASVHAVTITVTNTSDNDPGSLRQALATASDGDTINFQAGLSGTITLTTGQLVVGNSVNISGPGANNLTVNGNAAWRVFYINSGKTVTISGLTIMNGDARANANGFGGGIDNDHATLTVSNCTVSGNIASEGGGISNDGDSGSATLIITNSTIKDNSVNSTTPTTGAGIYNSGRFSGSATLIITNSTLSGNSGGLTAGGGIYNDGRDSGSAPLTITNSTISGNTAAYGGGIANNGRSSGSARLMITNSTLSGNWAGPTFGGGILILNDSSSDNATLTIGETILNAGASGENISISTLGTVTSLGYNLSSDDASAFLNGTGDQNSTNPSLGPLQNNGGSTFTHELLTGSLAIDAGPPPLDYDQRGPGYLRVVNGHIDIGAFEVQPAATPTPTPTATAAPTPAAPTALDATQKTASSFTANWSSVSGATGYRLDVSTSSTFANYVSGYQDLDVGNVTSRNVTGLAASTFYYYRVRAYNGNGTSPNSNVITAKTKNS